MDAERIVGDLIDGWARLPLAEATMSIWRFVFDEQRLRFVGAESRAQLPEVDLVSDDDPPHRRGAVAIPGEWAPEF